MHAQKFKEVVLTIEEMFEHISQLILAMYGAVIGFRKPNTPDEHKVSTIEMVEVYRFRMYLTNIS